MVVLDGNSQGRNRDGEWQEDVRITPARGSCQQRQTYGEVSRDMGVIGLERAGKDDESCRQCLILQ
jgi:hypothetical protein